MNPVEGSDAAFVVAALTLYADLPDTPLRPSPADQSLARKLFTEPVPLTLIESALLLGTLRRLSRTPAFRRFPRSVPSPTSCRSSKTEIPTPPRRLSQLPQAEASQTVGLMLRNIRFLMTVNKVFAEGGYDCRSEVSNACYKTHKGMLPMI